MEQWKVLTDDEAIQNKPALDADFDQRGVMNHPVNFRPYKFLRHKWEPNEIVLVPMEREVLDD